MGTTARICIAGLTEKEIELIELRIRELASSIRRAAPHELELRIWRDDKEE